MSGISTKGVKKSFISKELKPGNVVAKICMIDLKKSDKPKDPKIAEWTLTLSNIMTLLFLQFLLIFSRLSTNCSKYLVNVYLLLLPTTNE